MTTRSHRAEVQTLPRWPLVADTGLIVQLVHREVVGRYRGSALGFLCSLLTPLFMLGVYTFVFGTVFRGRWAPPQGDTPAAETPTAEFALILFVGLIVFQLFGEVITRAPTLVLTN